MTGYTRRYQQFLRIHGPERSAHGNVNYIRWNARMIGRWRSMMQYRNVLTDEHQLMIDSWLETLEPEIRFE